MAKYKELLELLQEEAEIVEGDQDTEEGLKISAEALRSVMQKIVDGSYTKVGFTKVERTAVQDTLGDIGELYRFAGSPSGFVSDLPEETAEAKLFGEKALSQARSLGLCK